MDAPDLDHGAKGEWVGYLQELLAHQGFYEGRIDGDFGRGTLRAVHNAQDHYSLPTQDVVEVGLWTMLGAPTAEAPGAEPAATAVAAEVEAADFVVGLNHAQIDSHGVTFQLFNEGGASAECVGNNLKIKGGNPPEVAQESYRPTEAALPPQGTIDCRIDFEVVPDGKWHIELRTDSDRHPNPAAALPATAMWIATFNGGQAVEIESDDGTTDISSFGRAE